jgi:hypothetical protein
MNCPFRPTDYAIHRFDLNQAILVQCMLVFLDDLVHCPRTGQEVHGHVADELIDGETYELVTCTACGGTHLINPKTGRLLEQAKK